MNSPLVSTDWLAERLGDPELVILDATLAKPKAAASDVPNADLQIPGARFFDIDKEFSDHGIDLPHMMCKADQFAKAAQTLGIHNSGIVVIYDQHGVYSSPRAWWMLKSMGHDNVFVLDGGLPKWVEKSHSTETKKDTLTEGSFEAVFDQQCFVDSSFVFSAIEDQDIMVLDARSKGRFDGTQPEPREGLRGGHIPNSINLPFTEVVNGDQLKSIEELKVIFEPLNLEGKKLIFSCGSGLTACIILLAAAIAGFEDLAVYDGSWSEWGQPSALPVVQ